MSFWDQLLLNNAFESSDTGPEPILSSTVHSIPNTSTQPLTSFDLPDFPLPQNNIQPPPSQDLAFGPEYQDSDFQLPNLDTLVQELEPTDRSDPWSSSIDRLFEDGWSEPHNSGDFIDLTTDSSPPTMPVTTRKRKPSEQTSAESSSILPNTAKRKRTGNLHLKNENTAIEEVDLREVDDDQGLSKIVHEQQAATIRAQQQQESEAPLTLSTVHKACEPIYGSELGHLFCHTCIMEALIAGEHQGDQGKGQSRCPVCRKKVSRPRDDKMRAKDKRELIPLEIKFSTRSSMAKGKGKALVAD
ncbi:MAG: hypothetical protein LQ342_002929 [Letrouitia transgressa]|nr:MAG: hypothetical protein LQ342_002929 [Letrouitia transgressa]